LLYLASYSGKTNALESFRGFPGLEKALEQIDPIQLAETELTLIAGILKAARENAFTKWAGKQGLTLLAALPDNKLGMLPTDDLEFILTSAAAEPVHENVIQLIRDRYEAAAKLASK